MPRLARSRALLVATSLALLAPSCLAQIDISADLETIRANRKMPGIVAMAVKQGRIVAQGAAGVRRQGNSTPLLITDRVNIGSCTKWLTGTLAGRLVDRGVISWTTRVRDVFPNYATFNTAFHDATLDQLLAHRAGVQQGITFENQYWTALGQQTGTISQIRRWVSDTVLKDPPEVTPGNYLYANQGYTVAATMLELASGKDWETLIAEEIFTPARMRSAGFGQVSDGAIPPATPSGHDLAAGGTTPVPRALMGATYHKAYQASNGPGGYVACTLRDWAMFLHLHMTSDLSDYLSAASGIRLQQPFTGPEGYGRGIWAGSRSWATPGLALNHSGDIFGNGTVVWAAPAKDFIAIIHTNCRSADDAVFLAMDEVAGLLISRYINVAAAGPLLEEPFALPMRRAGNGFAFDFFTLPGLRYHVESSAAPSGWTIANGASGQTATSLKTTFTDPAPAAQKFFRARVAP